MTSWISLPILASFSLLILHSYLLSIVKLFVSKEEREIGVRDEIGVRFRRIHDCLHGWGISCNSDLPLMPVLENKAIRVYT